MLCMNILFLDREPSKAAKSLSDRHLHYAISETAQILSTAWWRTWTSNLDTQEQHIKTFGLRPGLKLVNEPMVLWAIRSKENYRWAAEYLSACFLERKVRWPSLCLHEYETYKWTRAWYNTDQFYAPPGIIGQYWTNPPQIVDPSCVKQPEDFVEAYRKYYKEFKQFYMALPLIKNESGDKPMLRRNTWTNREIPEWLNK